MEGEAVRGHGPVPVVGGMTPPESRDGIPPPHPGRPGEGTDPPERGRGAIGRNPALLAEVLKEAARAEGFDLVGVTRPDPSHHGPALGRWLEAGYHGSMAYLARPDAMERRLEPARNGPGGGVVPVGVPGPAGGPSSPPHSAGTVLVVGHEYFQPDPPGVLEDPSRGIVARYARGRDYHKVVGKGLRRVHRRICEVLGRGVPHRVYVDTGPVLERELGVRAGLGWFGRNTMLIHPRRGSYFFLGALFLGLDAEPDPPFEADRCGTCRSCLDACPTGALLGRDAEGAPIMDARLCISYLTIENRGPIPRELRPLMGNRIYGCDICQEVCPFNGKFAAEAAEPGYAARGPGERPVGVEAIGPVAEGARHLHPGTNAPSLTELLEMALSEERWDAFSRGSAIRRAGRAGFARNVCVAVGNWLAGEPEPPPAAVAVLTQALSDPEPLVRGHAAWALGQAATKEARFQLSVFAKTEEHPWVRKELVGTERA